MKYKTKTDIDNLVAQKREIGSQNLRQKLQDLRLHENDPTAIQRYKEKQIHYYKNEIHSLQIQIRRREENMEIARQLFEKNRHREGLKLYKAKKAIETLQGYLAIYAEKKKKKKVKKAFIPPDPVIQQVPDLQEPEPEPEIPADIPLTEEERKILIRLKEEELKALEEKEEEEEDFPCPHCGRIYGSAPVLKRHITMRHKEE